MSFEKSIKIQRIVLFGFLGLAVLSLVYALGFLTNTYLFFAYGDKQLNDFYKEMQQVNTRFLWQAVTVIVLAVLLLLLDLKRHIAGIVTLCVSLVFSLAACITSVLGIVELMQLKAKYASLDLTSLNRYIERGTISYEYSTLTFDLGIIMFAVLALTAVGLAAVVFRNAVTVVEPEENKAAPAKKMVVDNETI